jgi:hypothetical protein
VKKNELGLAERPLSSSIAPNRRQRPTGGPKSAIGIFCEGDLSRLRGMVFSRFHDDEVREGLTVLIRRGGRNVGRIDCGTEALGWDGERICAGIRFKRGRIEPAARIFKDII